MRFSLSLVSIAIAMAVTTGCTDAGKAEAPATPETAVETVLETTSPETRIVAEQTQDQVANKLFDELFMAQVMRSPIYQTYLGIKDDYGKWDDLSEAHQAEGLALLKQQLAQLQALDTAALSDQVRLSHRLMSQMLQDDIEDYQWRLHSYPVNQMYGYHSMVPSLLINQHQITNIDDANAYVSRLKGVTQLFDQVIDALEVRAEMGIIAPKFVFPYVINDSQNLLTGAPFVEDEADSTLLADFKGKVNALEITQEQKATLIADANKALLEQVGPAYTKLIAYLQDLEQKADTRDGAWKFPQGEAFYNNALKRTTTTDLNADQIHQLGLQEVARIHEEMRQIMLKVGFTGSLREFFTFTRTDEQFYYPNTAEGKQAYLTRATELIDNMKGRLDELFLRKPKADLTVKAVEPFREKSAGKAFYNQPPLDNSRPGIYYANLYNMADMPNYQMEALAYHEGIPGHHMQIAIAQELENVPTFRKVSRQTAYVEGWGLYSELLPKEIGLYQDPYSDFGRLAMELWRACRLVVDTGIHAKKWSREQAIAYLADNTPNAEGDVMKAIERYIVMPSQATAYKVGMLKILELRAKAKQTLGEKFDIREFHEVVLSNGAVPLNVLEELVDDYIASQSALANQPG